MVPVTSSPIFLAPMNMAYHNSASFYLGFSFIVASRFCPNLVEVVADTVLEKVVEVLAVDGVSVGRFGRWVLLLKGLVD